MADEAELAFVAKMRDEASAVARNARRTLDSVGGKTTPIETDLRVRDGVTGTLRGVSAKLDEVSRKTIDTGKKLTTSLTLPIVGMGLAVGKASIDFSRGMGDVASLLPGNTARVNELRDEVMRIGPAAGASLGDVSKGLYQTLSAFGDTADTAKILELNARGARAGAASVADAINLTSAVTKAYGDTSAKAVEKASDLALLTVRLGQTTFPELAGSVGMVTPLTKALNVSQEELFGTMATFTGVTGGASEVSTQLRGALQGLMAPTADASAALQDAGYKSGAAAVQHEGLEGAIGILTDASEKSGKPLQNYISSIEGQMIALGLAGPQAEAYAKNLKEMGHASGTTSEAFKASTTGAGEQAFQWDKAKAEGEKLLVTIGDGLGPAVLDLIDALRPAAKQVGEWAQAFADADPKTQKLIATAIALAAAIGPLLVVLGTLGRGVSGIIGGVSSLSSAFGRGKVAADGYAASATRAQTGAARLGTVAKGAAGAAGIGLLTSSLMDAHSEGNSFGSVMKGVAGGAGIGAMFGPIGALVGAGVGGGLSALVGSFHDTVDEARNARIELMKTQGFENAKADADTLRTALDGVVNAYGRTARASVEASFTGSDGKLEEDVAKLRSVGVSMDTITSAAMGNAAAQRVVNAALSQGGSLAVENRNKYRTMWGDAQDGMVSFTDYYGNVHTKTLSGDEIDDLRGKYRYWDGQVKELTATQQVFGRRIAENTGVIDDHRAHMVQLARALGIPLAQYKKFPKNVRTHVEGKGLPQTSADAVRLIKQYKGLQDFKAIRAIVSAKGVDLTRRQVLDLTKQYHLTPKEVRTLFRLEGLDTAQRDAKSGGEHVKRSLEEGPGKARMNPSGYHASIRSANSGAQSIGSSGARGVGSAMGAGVSAGLGPWVGPIASQAAAMVTTAINAARAAAHAHSPSRKTEELGRDLGAGLERGLVRSTRGTAKAATTLTGKILGVMLRDLVGGADQVEKALGTIDQRITGHYADQLRHRQRALRRAANTKEEKKHLQHRLDEAERSSNRRSAKAVKNLRDEHAAIRANANEYDRLRQRLKDATDQGVAFAQTLKDYASVASFQPVNDAPVTAGFLVQDLGARLKAIRAFAKDLATLRSRGVAGDVVRDLEAQGVEAGAASAAALAGATNEQIREINRLSGEIGSTADDAGTAAVRGLVRGITNELDAVDAVGRRLANRLRTAIRHELGIKSPSRRLAEDGRNAARGLGLGILDEARYAERAASSMADRVAAAAVPSLPELARLSNAAALRPLVVRSSEVLVIRHEVTSPDGSVDELTAAQVADLIARDPRSARGIEDALSRHRARRAGNTIRSTGR